MANRKAASVHRLSARIAAREQANYREKVAKHNCVLERRAIADQVAIGFENESEQHRLHLAFNEEWCAACSVCERMKAAGQEATKLQLREIHLMRMHWRRLVLFAQFFQKPHVRAGCEVLLRYNCTRDLDANGNMMMFPGLPDGQQVSAEDAERLSALGWRVVELTNVWRVGMEASI